MNEPSRDGLPRQERGQEQLADEEQLADYLDYLHMQTVKEADPQRHSLDEVKKALALG